MRRSLARTARHLSSSSGPYPELIVEADCSWSKVSLISLRLAAVPRNREVGPHLFLPLRPLSGGEFKHCIESRDCIADGLEEDAYLYGLVHKTKITDLRSRQPCHCEVTSVRTAVRPSPTV